MEFVPMEALSGESVMFDWVGKWYSPLCTDERKMVFAPFYRENNDDPATDDNNDEHAEHAEHAEHNTTHMSMFACITPEHVLFVTWYASNQTTDLKRRMDEQYGEYVYRYGDESFISVVDGRMCKLKLAQKSTDGKNALVIMNPDDSSNNFGFFDVDMDGDDRRAWMKPEWV